MISNWFKKLKSEDPHPAESTLLACVDGELSAKETARVRTHLENCWSCRTQLDELQDTIRLFVNFRNQIQSPLIEPPPNDWNAFDGTLAQGSEAQNQRPSTPKRFSLWHKFTDSVNFKEWSPLRTRISIGSLAALLIVALVWQLTSVGTVSAAEFLQNAERAQAKGVEKVKQPVIYQKLRLEKAGAKPIQWEIWHDKENSRFRYAASDERQQRQLIPITLNTDQGKPLSAINPVLQEVSQILIANRMDPQRPLSVESFQAWRNSLTLKTDEIEHSTTPAGFLQYTLKTVSAESAEIGKITQATLTVRESDWHAERLSIAVKNENGTVSEYEFVETGFEVVSLHSISPEIFSRDPLPSFRTEIASNSSANNQQAIIETNENSNSNAQLLRSVSTATNMPSMVASAELEVEVLELLHQAEADLGEQVEVVREPNGPVKINGVVASVERKNKLLNALHPVSNNRAVQINIQTVEEAVAAEQQKKLHNKATAPAVVQMETHRIEGLSFPAESQVREYFAKQGAGENAIGSYAARTVNRSAQAMKFLYALKRLKNQIKSKDFEELTPSARMKLLGLVKSYSRSYRLEVAALRRELQPVFGGSGVTGNSVVINSDADLFAAIDRLVETGSACNKAVNDALTTGGSKIAGGNALRSAEFWKNLATASAIAEQLQGAK